MSLEFLRNIPVIPNFTVTRLCELSVTNDQVPNTFDQGCICVPEYFQNRNFRVLLGTPTLSQRCENEIMLLTYYTV